MFKQVLIPTDGSRLSEEAIRNGMQFAKEIGAGVTVLTVSEPFHVFSVDPDQVTETPPTYKQNADRRASRHLAFARASAEDLAINCETIHLEHEESYRGIIETAGRRGCDLIIMASHGRRGTTAVLLGSETMKVLTHSTIPVLVYRPEYS